MQSLFVNVMASIRGRFLYKTSRYMHLRSRLVERYLPKPECLDLSSNFSNMSKVDWLLASLDMLHEGFLHI